MKTELEYLTAISKATTDGFPATAKVLIELYKKELPNMPKEYEVLIIEDNDQRHKHTVIFPEGVTPTDDQIHLEALRWFERHHGTSRATEAAVHIMKRP